MSCNTCANFNGQICLWPRNTTDCRDCLTSQYTVLVDRKKELRCKCATAYVVGLRTVDCPDCPQRELCQKENEWSGERIETEFERRQEAAEAITPENTECREYLNPNISVKKRKDGKFDVYIHGQLTFHFVTKGDFIKE